MVKKLFLSLGLSSLIISGVMACEPQGCTPGYWKNHTEAWTNNPFSSYAQFFSVDAAIVNDMVPYVNKKAESKDEILSLYEAVWLKGNDDKLKQLIRTSVAAMENIQAGLHYKVEGYDERMWVGKLRLEVQKAFSGEIDAGELQRVLDDANNAGCPLN